MIEIQKQKKRFFIGTFFLVFFFAFSVNFNNNPVYAQAPTEAELEAASKPLALPIATRSETFNKAAKFLNQTPLEAAGNIVIEGFKWLLYGVFTFCSFLAMLAASIFSYVLDVSHLQAIMSNPVIWEMWKIVRDFFNLFFIFSLLLVAFSTIFQVSKFGGLKSIWSIVLAALFINFSFPITRAIIDIGNVMMYSFINDIFGMTKDSLNSGILSTSGLKGLFLLDKFQSGLSVEYYLIAIICMFMFGISFLTLALMMFYRLFMLPILVMFSPIGFAGSAIPGFGGYSKQWWDKLIKNVFFGPIAVFMMMIAVKFLQVLASSSLNIAGTNAITQNAISPSTSGVSGTLISSIVYMTIPIIFFWIAITSAEKMSSEASGIASSFGSKFLKKSRDWGVKRAWQYTGKNTYDGLKDKYNRTFHEPRGLGYSWRVKQAELKKNDDEKRKQEDEAKAKPGQEAARASMNKSDLAIIAKGKAPGASAKQKAAGIAAQKRYNKRLQTSNVEEMKKQKESIENSGLVGIDSTSDEAFKMTNPHAPGFDATRDGYAKRAANAEKFKASMNDRDEFVDFVRRDAPTASSKINSLISMSAADAVPRHIKGTPKEAGFIVEYTARQVRAQRAFANIQHDLGVNPNAVLDKAELASMRSFMSWRMDHVVGEGADFDTDRDPIIP